MEKKTFMAMLFAAVLVLAACNKQSDTPTGPAEPIGDKTEEEAAVGDYLMSDGTVLDQGTELTSDLASKVVGIVFYVGHHDKDLSDYSESGIGQEKCHGYAVALTNVHNDETDGLHWAYNGGMYQISVGTGNTAESGRDWNGYLNNRKFHDFVKNNDDWNMEHFRAALACETYGNRTLNQWGATTTNYAWQRPLTAPSSTSGWFLPSAGQMVYLQENEDILSIVPSRMTAVQNSLPDDCNYKDKIHYLDIENEVLYWSSTEYDESRAHAVYVNSKWPDKATAMSYTKGTRFHVRAVLAF